ncbi:hypothetical protein SeMB42_g03324 [Synchytrium endobioticum]|uniref:VLRF1 domain-containing protein n=1 Tax=Synchytrium endobioticum TaxID=286115 RepID=A0A507D7J9_9FUNG|nr:hypothetical protein SeMB42_g03324 [Synchytrium endobioticum]
MASESVPRLGPAFLSRLSVTAAATAASDIRPASSPSAEPPSSSISLGEPICSSCQLKFRHYDDQRLHYKSDYHRFNQQRTLKRRPTVTEDDFDNMSDVSSIEGSDSDDDAEAHGDGNDDSASNPTSTSSGSPMIAFPLVPDSKHALFVYKALLVPPRTPATPAELVAKLHQLQTVKYFTLFMTGAGHFAGAVFDVSTGKALVHKTIHRYTTRRKQGGAQSANDKSKGNAHSAGAGLRRYNEMALEKDIHELMVSWKDQIQKSSLIFLRASQSSRKAFLADSAVLKSNDDRIRGYPFTTRRATYTELQRAYRELTAIRTGDATCSTTQDNNSTDGPQAPPMPKAPVIPPPSLPQEQQLDPYLFKIIDLTRRGKVDLLATALETLPESVTAKLLDSEGTSLLHVAASSNQPAVVDVLLSKHNANPCVKNMRNLRPYDVATDKDTRNAFRRVMHRFPDLWDWKDAHVPSPLSPEMEEEQKAKDKIRKAVQREKEKAAKKAAASGSTDGVSGSSRGVTGSASSTANTSKPKSVVTKLSKTEAEAMGMTPEARARLDREKRAMAAEARMRSQQNVCANCKKSLAGLVAFDKLLYRYCSTECIRAQQLLHT